VWGALFLVGGIALWMAVPGTGGSSHVPEVWRETTGPATTDAMQSNVRTGGALQGDLLRLEWPSHPHAHQYRLRFLDTSGNGPAPVTVQGTVFLYDMRSNALHLPPSFTWEVTAVLTDGSEVVTPRRLFPGS
jgi:hypothetical protein